MGKYTVMLTIGVIGVVAAAPASGGSAQHQVARQRIAIEERFDTQTQTGTFAIYPLTPGPLKYDKGAVTVYGGPKGTVLRNGMKVELIVGANDLTGKFGTLRLAQELARVAVQDGTSLANDVGTWSVTRASGAYHGFKGGGRFAAVEVGPIVDVRQEGWISG
jgi:hypothetical protein